ncbi:hypothetical protein [Actinomycetospora soli]|uniref:hypothetical protein n=1 Tax=Actinomycetospora soli TaxID=2893887 RepID=UPI001E550334|nr:hypothetical protein [Actinomycetospora soli]MCD2187417.1 hypothetical protein [Actinomycetospora soli]
MTTDLLRSPATLAIVVGEIAFWLFLVAGLAARYVLRAPRLGLVLLAGTLLVDVAVLTTAVVDVRAGGAATFVHGLAALYVGTSVAFGRSIIAWADGHAAHRWAGADRPRRVPRHGRERAAHEWRLFARWLLAAALAAGAIGLVVVLAGPGARVTALTDWFPRLGVVTAVWFLTGPVWHLGGSTPARRQEPES